MQGAGGRARCSSPFLCAPQTPSDEGEEPIGAHGLAQYAADALEFLSTLGDALVGDDDDFEIGGRVCA